MVATYSLDTFRSRNVTEGPANPPSRLVHFSGNLIAGTLSRSVKGAAIMELAIKRSSLPSTLPGAALSCTLFTAIHPSQNEMPTPLLSAGHFRVALSEVS